MNHRIVRLLAPSLLTSVSLVIAACGGAPADDDVGTSAAAISDTEKTAYEFFIGKGLRNFQAAAIVGNLEQESDVEASAVEYGGGPGRGIAQWSVGGRWNADHDDNVAWYAGQKGLSEWSLTLQLDFIWYELETFSGYGLSELRSSTSVSAATVAFEEHFEGCGTCDQAKRISYAEAVLSANGGGSSGGGGSTSAKGCYSDTLGREMQANACVQSRSDSAWYQCDNGSWVDRWDDPTACDGVYPL
jgi:hypothetical protein